MVLQNFKDSALKRTESIAVSLLRSALLMAMIILVQVQFPYDSSNL
jgi:hypothetical protein